MSFSDDCVLILHVDEEEEREVLGDLAEASLISKRKVHEDDDYEEISPKRVKRDTDNLQENSIDEKSEEGNNESSSNENSYLQLIEENHDVFRKYFEITINKYEDNEENGEDEKNLLKYVLVKNALELLFANMRKTVANLN